MKEQLQTGASCDFTTTTTNIAKIKNKKKFYQRYFLGQFKMKFHYLIIVAQLSVSLYMTRALGIFGSVIVWFRKYINSISCIRQRYLNARKKNITNARSIFDFPYFRFTKL